VLGYLGDDGLAGGELALDRSAAIAAVKRVSDACGLDVTETAEGILRVVRATMARAIRTVSVERGKDVRSYALVPSGGAGPLHGCALARELGMSTVLVPPAPGALAALGLLVASRRADASLSSPGVARASRDEELRSILGELEEKVLADLSEEGIAGEDATVELSVDCRYAGQSHELRIPCEGEPSFARIVEAFHRAHEVRFGFERESTSVEAVTFRAAALGPRGEIVVEPPRAGAEVTPSATRRVGAKDVPVYERSGLPLDAAIVGPAIVRELDSTTWIDEDSRAVVHASGALIVSVS
jgi:N-methylhydantoinase A